MGRTSLVNDRSSYVSFCLETGIRFIKIFISTLSPTNVWYFVKHMTLFIWYYKLLKVDLSSGQVFESVLHKLRSRSSPHLFSFFFSWRLCEMTIFKIQFRGHFLSSSTKDIDFQGVRSPSLEPHRKEWYHLILTYLIPYSRKKGCSHQLFGFFFYS